MRAHRNSRAVPWPGLLSGLGVLSLVCLCGGCGAGAGPGEAGWRDRPHSLPQFDWPAASAAECPGGQRPRETAGFTVALPGAVAPWRAPLPRSEAERHIFRNCYETLVRIDCAGNLEPGLAASWQAYDGGRTWVFRLRQGARFWDGTPLGAVHVITAWRSVDSLCRQEGEPSPFLRFSPHGAALQVLGPRELAITLHVPDDLFVWLLANPLLAVVGAIDAHGWPIGSGPLRPLAPPSAGELLLAPVAGHPAAPPWSQITILTDDRPDPRDWLDLGADALVTRLHAAVAYYAERQDARLEPLPWDRSYYLLVPTEQTGATDEDRRRWASGWDKLELAREVSRQTAEPALFFPFEPLPGPCPVLPPLVPQRSPPSLTGRAITAARDADLILWPSSDLEAGLLADRLTALAARPLGAADPRPGIGPLARPPAPQPGIAPEAVAVPDQDLAAHVQAARAGAVILPWPHRWPLPCDDLASLLSLAEWLVAAGYEPDLPTGAVPPGATAARPSEDYEPPPALAVARRLERNQAAQPLLRTRACLVRKPGLVGLTCDHDGALRLWTGGRDAEP